MTQAPATFTCEDCHGESGFCPVCHEQGVVRWDGFRLVPAVDHVVPWEVRVVLRLLVGVCGG